MDHQDWNTITLNNNANKTKLNNEKSKLNSQKVAKEITDENIKIEIPKDLGKTIAQGRSAKSKNQKQLAGELGVSQQLLARWESNKEYPTNLQIANIEKILGVKIPRIKKVRI